MPADIVDEESRLALIGSIGVEGESEWVAQSDAMQSDKVDIWIIQCMLLSEIIDESKVVEKDNKTNTYMTCYYKLTHSCKFPDI